MHTATFPLLQTERLLLRQFQESDIDNVFRGLSHPDVIRYYGISFETLEDTQEQMQWFRGLEDAGTGIWWALTDRANGTFYGAAGLYQISTEHRKGEAGFWLLPEYWGQGLVVEAMRPILDYGFRQRQLHRIEAFVEKGNDGSGRVLQKLGFAHEGRMIDCEIKHDRFISLDIYALIRPTAP